MDRKKEDITEDQKTLLAQVRDPSDRQQDSFSRIIRIYYSENSGEKFSQLILETEYDGARFENAALYDAGSDDGLQAVHNILTHIPQIVEMSPNFTRRYDNHTRDALEKAIDRDASDADVNFEMAHQAAI
ncbi:hypothetical protein N7454_009320 [Penicillium verhagenii]|nr:hypothetical protein N7454_009320 [Penicillium verhagenii]